MKVIAMSSAATFSKGSTGFPQTAVEAAINTALSDQVATQATLKGNLAKAASLGSWELEIDSLVVVELICAVEEQLGVALPQSFIPRGGYATKAECVADLVAQTKAVWAAKVAQESINA